MTKPRLQELEVLIGNWEWTLSNAWFLDSLETKVVGTASFDMQRMRGSVSPRISKAWTAISRDDLDTRVLAKPGGHRFLCAVG